MPTSKGEIRRLIGKLEKDPGLVDELLNSGDEKKRKEILVKKGHLKASDKPTRAEIKQEMYTLLTSDNPPPADGGRVVEWAAQCFRRRRSSCSGLHRGLTNP
jgi:hypothetical protein